MHIDMVLVYVVTPVLLLLTILFAFIAYRTAGGMDSITRDVKSATTGIQEARSAVNQVNERVEPIFPFLAGVVGLVSFVLSVTALLFSWGNYSATTDRLREVMERNQAMERNQYKLQALVDEIVQQEGSKERDNQQLSSPQPTAPPRPTQPRSETTAGALHIDRPALNQQLLAGEVTSVGGRHFLPAGSLLWVVLRDAYGNFYLQNRVTFEANNSWRAPISFGSGITELRVVRVTPGGDEYFQQMVLKGERGAFKDLPPGTVTVARESIEVQ